MHGIALRDREGRVTGGVCVIEDITGRKQAEEALEMSRRTLFEAQRLAHVGSWHWDLQANKVDWSPEIYRITGLDPDTYDGSPDVFLELVHPDDKAAFTEVMGKTLSQRETSPLEYRLIRPDGSVRTVYATGTLVLDAEGRTTQCIGTIQDITERRLAEETHTRLQQQLQQAQKMESLGNLSGGIAHDMNNVLGAILGIASANVQIQPPGSPAHNSFETIVKAATRGGEMVRGLLSFARQSQAEERALDLNTILKDEADLLARTTLAKVELRLDLEADLLPIKGDEGALTHAFMNLCVNSVDAMPENGTLSIHTRNIGREWVEVVIEDTGLGMSKEVLDRAMDPFFTTKGVGKGTGLGLTMVYKTVKAHRGVIEIQSQPGRGTQVTMRFPASEPVTTDPDGDSGTRLAAPARALRILLVDDDELIRSSTGMVVQTLGHAVTASSSGEEALTLVEAGLLPDAVILDMNMPGMGGAGTLPRLRELLPRVPVLLSSSRTDQAALDLSKVHDLVTVLPKPFSIKELKECLEALAGGRGEL
jgi:PAS domain S-box-containing protein